MIYGEMIFDDGTRFNCYIDITEERYVVNQSYIGSTNFIPSPSRIAIKIIANVNSNIHKLYNSRNQKINCNFTFSQFSVSIVGLYINYVTNKSNVDVEMDGECDYYEHTLSEKERLKIIREKKLKRILN